MGHGLDGKWEVTITSKMGQQKALWDLKVTDGTITGEIFEEPGKIAGTVESTESISEDSFGFKTTLKTRFGKLAFTMTGKVTGPNEISGEAVMKMMGASGFVGKRV